jgi:hypothetical protein
MDREQQVVVTRTHAEVGSDIVADLLAGDYRGSMALACTWQTVKGSM